MWLVSCRRQGMLTQGPTPDPKCELNITSFLTLPHPLHCPICAKDIMVTVLLLQVMVGSEGWRVFHLCQGLDGGTEGGYHVFSNFCSVFVLLLVVLSWLFVASVSMFLFCFLCFWSLQLGITSAWKLQCLFFKTISKVRFQITNLWVFLKKRECFDFNHPLGSLPYVV